MKEKSKNKDLFITDIDFEVEEEDLYKLFSLCGKVKNINMISDPRSGNFRGCAFVNMATAEEARDAINTLDGTRLLNRCITVKAARPKGVADPAGAPAEKPKREKRPRGRRQ